jgi:NADH pyrophosphatase NudC (nudix superfamily)
MFQPRSIKHCRACGSPVVYSTPADDNRDRATCTVCTTIHYENPLNVVGTLPVWQDKVLLCRRNIEPRYGFWTLPAGFMELGETTEQGAIRETVEEAGARELAFREKDYGAAFVQCLAHGAHRFLRLRG